MDLDPAFPGVCAAAREAQAQSCFVAISTVAHTDLDLANPRRIGVGKASRTGGKGFQNLVDAGFVDTFRLFKQATGTTRGGVISPIRAFATWDGESITFSFQRT